ncbi:hypothetical protein HanRHA438_Chr10g0447821 [Helianthus annuus]|nr:hypothetical protein HanRHA438_Chr10g0447821 [Helianthus annuus]
MNFVYETSFCLAPVSSVSRTSTSILTSYLAITSGSRNSTSGINAIIRSSKSDKKKLN